ncbi:MAG: cell division protein ZapB [Candidatus Oxydemutatoraceae bacterium WSBS_2016_MAG_OTU14]
MNENNTDYENLFEDLESRINSLLAKCQDLTQENSLLRDKQETILQEKVLLAEKSHQAQKKLASIIDRLKDLE